jgi:hypothetical protein
VNSHTVRSESPGYLSEGDGENEKVHLGWIMISGDSEQFSRRNALRKCAFLTDPLGNMEGGVASEGHWRE